MKKLRLKKNKQFAQVTQSVSSGNGTATKAIYAASWKFRKCGTKQAEIQQARQIYTLNL